MQSNDKSLLKLQTYVTYLHLFLQTDDQTPRDEADPERHVELEPAHLPVSAQDEQGRVERLLGTAWRRLPTQGRQSAVLCGDGRLLREL